VNRERWNGEFPYRDSLSESGGFPGAQVGVVYPKELVGINSPEHGWYRVTLHLALDKPSAVSDTNAVLHVDNRPTYNIATTSLPHPESVYFLELKEGQRVSIIQSVVDAGIEYIVDMLNLDIIRPCGHDKV
jgi:hypothetical protein